MSARPHSVPPAARPSETGRAGLGAHDPRRGRPHEAVYAALDLGTNNCRMLMAAPADDGFRVVESFSRIVRLGEGLHDSGRLCPAAMDRAIGALSACAARLSHRRLAGFRAIATEACRRAANGAEFLDRVRAETGIAVKVITPREEAELALESCAPLLADGGRRALVFDIGGGSTELAWVRLCGEAPALIGYISMPVGVVTLAEQFGPARFTAEGYAAMREEVAARLTGFERIHCIGREIAMGGVTLLGTSGTVTTLAGIALKLARYSRPLVDGAVLDIDQARSALAALRALGRDGLAAHPCIGPERVDFVLPGCAAFEAILEQWPASRIVVADRGLREGMLMRLIRA
ncbi:MAG: Ppx/GppA family phosphatase [Rhodospirillales bacterium]|nr:Ppx/GppA family phosphatase [Rhodospirillales bacterium]